MMIAKSNNRNIKNCSCKPVYDELHFEWVHSPDCASINNPDKFDADEAARLNEERLRQRVLRLVENDQWFRVAPKLLKKFAPDVWKEKMA